MPDIKRLQPLIDGLLKMSEAGKISWTETSDEKMFQASVGTYVVTIKMELVGQNWGEDIYRYLLRIHDNAGKFLDEITEADIPDDARFTGGLGRDDALKHLYDSARRKALNVDKALDDFLSYLK